MSIISVRFPDKIFHLLENKWIIIVIRLILGGIFIYASYDKILNPEYFARIIRNYHILPVFLVNLFAIILPWIELFSGFLLIIGIFTRGAALVISFLLFIFIIVLIVNVIRGLDVECGCFSTQRGSIVGIELILRDIILFFFSLCILKDKRNLP